ncbi:hypothetical protein Tdes44962_MAKER00531 [Teratosphaeria destructans]|uniref:Uncharacterized protein n=1 Tax=Teratosphaeria destructans TaxID=418781 RepID=A0A9W7W188_9PEZI|nr:hypothetical protein Tdes44962_MAKER00531 [Teratosphaeria destructans]
MPTQLRAWPRIAPPTGVPTRTPRAQKNVLVPRRPPTMRRSLVMLTTVVGWSERKAPLKQPYSRAQMIRPGRESPTAIQAKPRRPATAVQRVRT